MALNRQAVQQQLGLKLKLVRWICAGLQHIRHALELITRHQLAAALGLGELEASASAAEAG